MNTTESERDNSPPSKRSLTLRLLFYAEQGIVDECRALEPGHHQLGREVNEEHGLALPKDRQLSRQHAVIEVDAQHDAWISIVGMEPF
jgi:hypothetical protein